MSYDITLLNWQGNSPPPRNELGEFICEPLGDVATVRKLIKGCLRKVDWSDPSYGIVEHEDHFIEFNLGKESDSLKQLTVHLHDDSAFEPIKRLCAKSKWAAFDHQTNSLVDFSLRQPSFEELKERILSTLFKDCPRMSTASGIQEARAREFFDAFVHALKEQSESIGDFYADDATIVTRTNHSLRTTTGKDMKKQLVIWLNAARKTKSILFDSTFSDLYFLDEKGKIRIKCVLHSRRLNQLSPYEVLLEEREDGRYRIVEETNFAEL